MTPWTDGDGNTYLWGKPSKNWRMEDNSIEYDQENNADIDIEGCDYDDF